MALAPTYPGVYIEELPSSVRTIVGVPTSITAFVGTAPRGTTTKPKHIVSWGDFEREFGGLDRGYPMSYAVYQYYQNGGAEAEIVRIVGSGDEPVTLTLPVTGGSGIDLVAASPGAWGQGLRARVDRETKDMVGKPADDPARTTSKLWNLSVRDVGTGREERFLNIDSGAGRAALVMTLESSQLVRLKATQGNDDTLGVPNANATVKSPTFDPADPWKDPSPQEAAPGGPAPGAPAEPAPPGGAPAEPVPQGGAPAEPAAPGAGAAADPLPFAKPAAAPAAPVVTVNATDYTGSRDAKTGIYRLLDTDIFNLLVLSPTALCGDVDSGVVQNAANLCAEGRAVLIVDPMFATKDVDAAIGDVERARTSTGASASNAAYYFPWLVLADPVLGGTQSFGPAGAVAGVIARTDAQRGVWKAPAGQDAVIADVRGLGTRLNDAENGRLNPLAANCIRAFPIVGQVVWGARTLRGADALADQWKYLPVRRLALYIEESLYRGTKWAVFEPNAEPLWASLRLNVGVFMNTLFRQGAFFGQRPRDAYLVKCDTENNPQADIDRGIVNVLVGFAPLKPAEFVFIHIQQLAGQLET